MTTALPSLHRCQDCGRWFVDHPRDAPAVVETKKKKKKGKKDKEKPLLVFPVEDFVTHAANCGKEAAREEQEDAAPPLVEQPPIVVTMSVPAPLACKGSA